MSAREADRDLRAQRDFEASFDTTSTATPPTRVTSALEDALAVLLWVAAIVAALASPAVVIALWRWLV